MMNIVSAFLFQARYHPRAPAICIGAKGHNFVTYDALAANVNGISRHALLHGLKAGKTVAVFSNDPALHLALVLGLMRIGVVTFSTASQTLPTELRVDAVVSDTPGTFNVARVIIADASWTANGGAPFAQAHEDGASIGRIHLTTGTTGEPRAIALSHHNMMRRIQAYNTFAYGSHSSAHSKTLVDPNLRTAMGFLLVMAILLRGGTAFISYPNASQAVEAFSLFDVRFLIAAPATIAAILNEYERLPGLVCPLEAIVSGGSALAKSLSERVRQRMCSHLISLYGATEMGAVASAPAHHLTHIDGAVGYLLPDVAVQTCDENGQALAPGKEGLIRIRSDCGVAGYLGDPPRVEAIFREGWFYPGDIGAVTEDGVLVISGRQKTVLNIGGEKLHPEKIEQDLLAFPGIDQAGVFSVVDGLGIEEVWAAVVCSAQLDQPALARFCGQKIPSLFIPKQFVVVPTLPRNAMGKLDRRRLNEFASGAKAANPPVNP